MSAKPRRAPSHAPKPVTPKRGALTGSFRASGRRTGGDGSLGDGSEDFDTENIDTSLLEKMQAGPDEGTVLRRVEDWIEGLENKYAGRSLVFAGKPVDDSYSEEIGRTVSVYERDPVVVQDNVRRHISEVPFPSWDGKDTVIEKAESPLASPVQYYDYEPDLKHVDDESEDEDEDNRDAGARLVRAYANSCMKQAKTALPQVTAALALRKCENLMLANCSMACGGAISLGPYLGELAGLNSLDLSTNMIFDEGATSLAKALRACPGLTYLHLDNNKLGTHGARALAEQFKTRKSNLTYFSVRHNQLSDAAVSAIVDAMAVRKKIVKLILGHNAVGQQSCSSLANLLMTSRTLEWLDCHWGHIRQDGAVELAEALVSAETLKHLDLGWNGFGDLVPCSKLADALKLKSCKLEFLDLSHNRLKEQSAFLVAGPLEFNKSLQKLVLDGNPIGQSGCRRLMSSALGFKNSLESQVKDDRNLEISLRDCTSGVMDANSFDPAEPNGEYLFDMSNPYSRLIVRDLLKIEAMGKGQFIRHTCELNWEPYNLPKMTSFEKEAEVPEEGEFAFRFVSLRKPPWAGGDTELHDTVFESLMEHFQNNTKPPPGEHRMGKIEYLRVLITADTIFSYEQAAKLIVELLTSEEKIQFLAEIYHKFNEPDGNKRLARAFLTEAENKRLMMLMGPKAFAFAPNNPTGHHRLDLSSKEERDVAIKILDARNGNEESIQELQRKMANRQGGPRDQIELCWLNASLNGEHLHYERHWKPPRHGILELDFVTLLKPQDVDPNVEAVPDVKWREFLKDANESESLTEILADFRELTNTQALNIAQVKQMLSHVDVKYDQLRSRPTTPAQPGVHRERPLALQQARVEIVIIAFARTVDYFGFYGIYGLFNTTLTRAERHMLKERIGELNMFLSEMAVDFYELDFSDKSQRWIMQEIVHLAIAEPGQNCVNETFNDMDFPIPATWSKEVPRSGIFTCYYCREQDTINKICAKAKAKHPGSVPTDVRIPALTDWVYSAKCSQIKQKMADKFPNAKSCFSQIDKDGGGTIDRKEMAGGLHRLGVWLRPTELATLFAAVDEDGGGDVDFDEFEAFWLKW